MSIFSQRIAGIFEKNKMPTPNLRCFSTVEIFDAKNPYEHFAVFNMMALESYQAME
jgi:hypothetical protein